MIIVRSNSAREIRWGSEGRRSGLNLQMGQRFCSFRRHLSGSFFFLASVRRVQLFFLWLWLAAVAKDGHSPRLSDELKDVGHYTGNVNNCATRCDCIIDTDSRCTYS